MTISNPSFESPHASTPGWALNWDSVSDSQFFDVADFDSGYGWEGYERGWRLPSGRKVAELYDATETVWGIVSRVTSPELTTYSATSNKVGDEIDVVVNESLAITDNVSVMGKFFDSAAEEVNNPVAVIASGGMPPTTDVVVTMTYKQPSGAGGRVATVTIPAGSGPGNEFVFSLQGTDTGFNEIEDISLSEPVEAEIHILGSWLMSPLNETDKFLFSLASEIAAFSITEEDFEDSWGCLWLPAPNITGMGAGFLFDFDALNTIAARFNRLYGVTTYTVTTVGTLISVNINESIVIEDDAVTIEGVDVPTQHETVVRVETFDTALWTVGTLTVRPDLYALTSFIESIVDADSFVITEGLNDRLALKFTDIGTVHDVNIALSAGTYTPSQMVIELNSKIGAALDADAGYADSTHFTASLTSADRLRLETSYTGIFAGQQPRMDLLEPASDSAWATLGFIPIFKSNRYVEAQIVDVASFDITTPEDKEDFEEEWHSCEDGILTFGLVDPTYLSKALFDPSNSTYEGFESDWVLTLFEPSFTHHFIDSITVADEVSAVIL